MEAAESATILRTIRLMARQRPKWQFSLILRNLTRTLGLRSHLITGVRVGTPLALRTTTSSQADNREPFQMPDPNWKELLGDAYALACIVGVGGYLVAMFAL